MGLYFKMFRQHDAVLHMRILRILSLALFLDVFVNYPRVMAVIINCMYAHACLYQITL